MEQSFSDISLYHEYRSARETEHLVSQKTWDDLNLDDFFEWADRTSSCVGRQYLYDVLHYNRLSEISEQEEVIRKLSADKELRAEIRSELRKLDTPDAYTIASLFSISHPVYSRRFYRLLTILQFAPFVLLGIVYITSSLYVLGILCTSVLVNMVLHYRSKARDSGLFLFHSSVMEVAQASGEVGTDSVVCIRASGYPKDFAGIASVAKETFHFPFQYQTGERHRHFRLFLHRDSECVFSAGSYSGFQGFLSIAG